MSERKSRPLVIVVVLIVGVLAGAGGTLLVLLMPGRGSQPGRLALIATAWSYTVNIRRRAKSTW